MSVWVDFLLICTGSLFLFQTLTNGNSSLVHPHSPQTNTHAGGLMTPECVLLYIWLMLLAQNIEKRLKYYAQQLLQVQVNPPSFPCGNLMAISWTTRLPLLDSWCEYLFNVRDFWFGMTLFFNLEEVYSQNMGQQALGGKKRKGQTVKEAEVSLNPTVCMYII